MNTHKFTTKEKRLLFKERPSNNSANEEVLDRKTTDLPTVNTRKERLLKNDDIKKVPSLTKALQMSDEDYISALQKPEKVFPDTEESKDIRTAFEGMIKDFENIAKNIDSYGQDIEKLTSDMHEAINKNLQPLITKYKNAPEGSYKLMDGLTVYLMQEKEKEDRQQLAQSKKDGKDTTNSINGVSDLATSLGMEIGVLSNNYDKSLTTLLKDGASIKQIQKEYEGIKNNADPSGNNYKDAHGILEAIKKREHKHTYLMGIVMNKIANEQLSNAIILQLDPKDLEIHVATSATKVEHLASTSPLFKKNGDTITFTSENSTFSFVYDKKQLRYELTEIKIS